MLDQRSDEAVYEAHAAELVRYATGLVGPDDAPDVVVDAFVRLTASPVWPGALDRRALWFRAVTFEARSWRRSSARRRAREGRAARALETYEDPAPVDPEVVRALGALSTQQRAVVVLTYWLDLDPARVAGMLGVSEGSVRKQLARSRRKLERALR